MKVNESRLYPNLTVDHFRIYTERSFERVQITNLTGATYEGSGRFKSNKTYYLKNLPAGTYLLLN